MLKVSRIIRPATERVLEQLEAMIANELEPGAKLPSETALALDYHVSRLTVREAFKVLAGRGLLDIGRGRRAMVRTPNGNVFGSFLATMIQRDPKGMIELVEVRRALEVQAASLAAKNTNRAGLAAIHAALEGMASVAPAITVMATRPAALQRFHDFDVGFHEALALASGNRMLAILIEALAIPLRTSFGMSLKGREMRGGTTIETLKAHEAILHFVQAGDAKRAAQAMRAHLQDAERDMRAVLSRPIGTPSRKSPFVRPKR